MADPRMQQLIRDWSECMEGAGFEFTDRDEMLDDLDQRVTPFDEMLDSQWDELQRLAETAPNGDITALPADAQLALETPPTIPPSPAAGYTSAGYVAANVGDSSDNSTGTPVCSRRAGRL